MLDEEALAQWLRELSRGQARDLMLEEGRLGLRDSADGVMLQLEMEAMGRSPEHLLALLEQRYTDMIALNAAFIAANESGVWVLHWRLGAEAREDPAMLREAVECLRAWAAAAR
ncbi:hypothetical protein EKK97_09835 [Billgrantia tianxiuensis]|jgi:hypothetical protein|uniref:Uncharacterized protein n=1 Tax=Billgrantia tianxiuensis TaxID=2497861 RepID=A0A6I6SST0_9GAMM|nr:MULTISPECIES: hypothetical protein [Halomonas]MCE8032125.1 hypothetical protein [Halomonas sp. MCCC 1A11057]QHC49843.1 hypothetical protein EKK97_09835 [Halomonas tianxiuensis]